MNPAKFNNPTSANAACAYIKGPQIKEVKRNWKDQIEIHWQDGTVTLANEWMFRDSFVGV